MAEDTYAQLAEGVAFAIADAQMLDALAEAGEVGDMEKGPDRTRARAHHELDQDTDIFGAIDAIALEVYATANIYPHGLQTITGVVVVTGTGGPHIEFTVEESGSVLAEGWWGSDHVTLRAGGLESLATLLFDMFEEAQLAR
jgi:hypothetical protein